MKATIENLKDILSQTSVGALATDLNETEALKKQGVDSLDLLDFYLNIEETFNIHIADDDAEKLLSLNDYISYINERL